MPLWLQGSTWSAVRRFAFVFLFALPTLQGCSPPDQVSRYTAPKEPLDTDSILDTVEEGEPKVRILGAIVPAGEPGMESWYFFKMDGKPKAIARHVEQFDEFIQSLKFNANGPPSWTLPPGWREATVQSQLKRIATLRMKKSETMVDLAVTQFGGSLIENINRWREQQAGAEAITVAEIPTKCRVLTVDGKQVVIVDVSGPGGKGGGMMGPMGK